MTKLLFLLALITGLAVFPSGGTAADLTVFDEQVKFVEEVTPAIVGIRTVKESVNYHGTGVLITPDGYILTATGVVPPGAGEVKIRLAPILSGLGNGETLDAKVIFTDEASESVLLQVNGNGFSYLEMGDSDRVTLGAPAYTFGDVLGSINIDNRVSVSAGFISGTYSLKQTGSHKLEESTGRYNDVVIETTAAVNGGVDGGPLVGPDKKIIGLVCLNYSRVRWLGTAIPINKIKSWLNEKIKLPAVQATQINESNQGFSYLIKDTTPAIVGINVEFSEPSETVTPPVSPPLPGKQMRSLPPALEGEYKEYLTRPDGYLSGVLISADGYILTSYQNIRGEIKNISVSFQADNPHTKRFGVGDNQKQNFPAEVIGWDEELDLALLKVAKLPPEARALTFPDTVQLKAGHWAIVIGYNPDESATQPTLTAGLISAAERSYGRFFQLDAKINYGNFGGPVFNINGDWLGLVGRHGNIAQIGLNSGVGMAVTSEEIKKILPDLKKGQKIKRQPKPFLGIQADLGAVDIEGILIGEVIPDTAASRANLQKGDIIVEFNKVKIAVWRELVNTIKETKIGGAVDLKVKRDGKTIQVSVVMGAKEW